MKTKSIVILMGLTIPLTSCGQSVSTDKTDTAVKEASVKAEASENATPAETRVSAGTIAKEATVKAYVSESYARKTRPGEIIEHEIFRDPGNYRGFLSARPISSLRKNKKIEKIDDA
ncbi:MAG: hypothetical protein K5931_04085 [Lachnospiraceae bacterium]|nr:hypothetical protein [Lachnospiraceae bacterium]